MLNPGSFPFWFGGLLFLFLSRHAKNYRALGWTSVIVIAFLMITHGKDYYSAPAYVMLFAAGGATKESKQVACVYHSLTPEEQKRTAIFGNNYGLAGVLHRGTR